MDFGCAGREGGCQDRFVAEPAMLTQTAAAGEGADAMDMMLEVVTIPVSDVSRAREFCASLGWRPT